jgi:hypothetical protein
MKSKLIQDGQEKTFAHLRRHLCGEFGLALLDLSS